MAAIHYLYFPGCKLAAFLPEYDRATQAVLTALDVHLVHTELNCCGYPVRHENLTASVFSAARNLAIASQKGLALLTPCQCCYGNLRQAAYWLGENAALRRFVNRELATEGLQWRKGISVRHLLSVLAENVGLDAIAARVTRPLAGLSVAAHYGCHALRPGHVVQFDNPLAPTIFENLLMTIGAAPVAWPLRLDCCGYPARSQNPDLSLKLMNSKLEDARAAGARVLATACTYCQMQFDGVGIPQLSKAEAPIKAVLYPQLLGQAMGLPLGDLGLFSGTVARM